MVGTGWAEKTFKGGISFFFFFFCPLNSLKSEMVSGCRKVLEQRVPPNLDQIAEFYALSVPPALHPSPA